MTEAIHSTKVEPGDHRQLVLFMMGGTEFGIDIHHVREVIRLPEVTRMPRTPVFVEGIINLRGRILPVLDLTKRFQLQSLGETPDTRVMIVEWHNQTLGFIVDRVREVLKVSSVLIAPPPDMILTIAGRYLEGIVDVSGRLLILLDLDRILDQEEIRNLSDVESRETGTKGGGA
jgi:purine-binding chemotaxis protein CheW